MATAIKKPPPKKAAATKDGVRMQAKVSAVKAATVRKASTIGFRPNKKETAILQKLGRKGANNAIRASKALGLSITYLEKGFIVREKSNGGKEIIATVSIPLKKTASSSLKKGMIFHAKK